MKRANDSKNREIGTAHYGAIGRGVTEQSTEKRLQKLEQELAKERVPAESDRAAREKSNRYDWLPLEGRCSDSTGADGVSPVQRSPAALLRHGGFQLAHNQLVPVGS